MNLKSTVFTGGLVFAFSLLSAAVLFLWGDHLPAQPGGHSASDEPFPAPEQSGDEQLLSPEQKVYYHLQGTDPSAASRAAVQGFVRSYYTDTATIVIQGFSCNTLGPARSYALGRQRAEGIRALLVSRGVAADRILKATERVLEGEPRTLRRVVSIHLFYDRTEAENFLNEANTEAAIELKQWKEAGFNGRPITLDGELLPPVRIETNQGIGRTMGSWGSLPAEIRFFLAILVSVMGLILIFIMSDTVLRSKRVTRFLQTSKGASVRRVLAGLPLLKGSVPDPVMIEKQAASSGEGPPTMEDGDAVFLEDDGYSDPSPASTGRGRGVMEASLRREGKPVALEIRLENFLHPEFSDLQAKDLRDAPVEALAGIGHREAQLLKEAFGIDTIGQLAEMHHVRVARAVLELERHMYGGKTNQ